MKKLEPQRNRFVNSAKRVKEAALKSLVPKTATSTAAGLMKLAKPKLKKKKVKIKSYGC